MEKPDVDQIDGLSPAISIDQKGASRNPRSTVGTVTEIYDYLRLLFARIGRMHCPICGREITRQTVEQIVDQLYDLPDGTRLMLMAPLVRDRKGEHEKVLAGAKAAGFVRVRVDGQLRDTRRRRRRVRRPARRAPPHDRPGTPGTGKVTPVIGSTSVLAAYRPGGS